MVTKSEAGRKGAQVRNERMTPEQKSESARKAALARHAKSKEQEQEH